MADVDLETMQARKGESVKTVENLRVERGKIAEFARAIQDPTEIYYDREAAENAGHPRVPAPPTFLRSSYLPRYRPPGIDGNLGFDFGLDSRYLVHGEQAFEFERPVYADDTLSGETTLVDVFRKSGRSGGEMTFVVLETEFTDGDGELVATSKNTRIETAGAIGSSGDEPGEGIPSDGTRPPARAELTGDTDAGLTATVSNVQRIDFVRYAGASGDFNAIHYDEPYARAAGNRAVFGQGMLTAGVASIPVRAWNGLDAVRSFSTRFSGQLWPGTDLVVRSEVATTDASTVELSIVAESGDGDALLTGSAVVDLA